MPLLIHATLEVSGDAALLPALRQQINGALAEDYGDMPYTETHRDDALHYDLKTTSGIPFPVLIGASEQFPDLVLSLRWINPDLGTQGNAEIRAGRIETQSIDALDPAGAGRQPGYVAAHADGTLWMAFALFSVRNDGCTGYAISAEKDVLFQIERQGDRAELRFCEGEEGVWDAGWEYPIATGISIAVAIDPWAPLPIDAGDYERWRAYAQAFVSEWFWFDGAAAEETIIERQRFADQHIPVKPANLRYQKLKLMREREVAASGLHELDHLGEDERYLTRILAACFVEA